MLALALAAQKPSLAGPVVPMAAQAMALDAPVEPIPTQVFCCAVQGQDSRVAPVAVWNSPPVDAVVDLQGLWVGA
jgi:hypothetical protein